LTHKLKSDKILASNRGGISYGRSK